jgi:rare lipoprotein A
MAAGLGPNRRLNLEPPQPWLHNSVMIRQVFAVATMCLFAVSGCTLAGYPSPVSYPFPDDTGSVVADVRSSGSASRTYEVFGQHYTTLASSRGYRETGVASWYGEPFHGRPTASGEVFDMYALTAAHRTLPLNTCVEVRRLIDGRTVTVKVNDRGPFADVQNRIIDLSFAAAQVIGLIDPGTAEVEVRALDDGESCG